jgi:hypothetical protein
MVHALQQALHFADFRTAFQVQIIIMHFWFSRRREEREKHAYLLLYSSCLP